MPYLFTFQRISNSDKIEDILQSPWPDILAIHPTRETLTEEEWEAILDRATKRCIPELGRVNEICDQMKEQFKSEGGGRLDDEFLKRRTDRLTELGAIPAGINKSVMEVLEEEGFQVLTQVFEKFTFQAPMTARGKEIEEAAERLRAEIGLSRGFRVTTTSLPPR